MTGIMPTKSHERGLRAIIDQAIELSRLFRVQRAAFTVQMPSVGEGDVVFDDDFMEDINGEDGKDLKGTRIQCVVFPCFLKFGDEDGDHVRIAISLGLGQGF